MSSRSFAEADSLRLQLAAKLRSHLAGEVGFDIASCRLYATDASHYQVMPLGVVIPRSSNDLTATVQIAREFGVPIISRGGGTSLSGQSIGPGIIVDCSKYLNRIRDLDISSRRVWVEPGLVLDHLNASLAPHGLLFGPDVATANRATIGGMIGNNSAGSRSIVYGKTIDHVRSLDTILSDGTNVRFQPMTARDWDAAAVGDTRSAQAYRMTQSIVREHADEIRQRFPHIIRRVSGYNLAAFVDPEASEGMNRWRNREPLTNVADCSMVPLLVGSEGTLAIIAAAELTLESKPKYRGLLVPHLDSLAAAMEAVATCLEARPTAVELMDAMLITLARTQRSLKQAMTAIEGHPTALLMVEFSSDDPAEIADRIEKLRRLLVRMPGCTAAIPAIEASVRDPLWNLRSSAVPLLYGMPGDRKPVTFVEDTAVDPSRLPEFVARFQAVIRSHGTEGAFYGHASVGCLHIRPLLNLKDPDDIVRMRAIMDDISNLVLEFGGALSGEHGDGMVRSAWNRKMYGSVIDDAFRQIKRAFDPDNRLNPGKIVDGPAMEENFRPLPSVRPSDPPTAFDYSHQGGFYRSIELCNGAGVCRKTQGGAMCPSFRATRDEHDSTRGRANALRIALAGESAESPSLKPLQERWLHDIMDLCISCKACKSECPSNVDLAKLKAEFQHAYYAVHARPASHRLARHVHTINRIGSWLAPVVNPMNQSRPMRWLMERLLGIDRRRSLPRFDRINSRRWMQTRKPTPNLATKRVMLMADCFTTYTETNVFRSAVRVLEAAGYGVEIAPMVCCGRAMISKGYLTDAKTLIHRQVGMLVERVRDGTPILGLEPSCILSLVDEWPELVPGEATQTVAKSAFLADDWISERMQSGEISLPLKPATESVVFHGHCHQRALIGVTGTVRLLSQVPGIDLTTLDAGCCGMAGSFGYEREHFDISQRIAGLQLVPALAANPDSRIVATGTSCRHQIHDCAQRTARHPLELVADLLSNRD